MLSLWVHHLKNRGYLKVHLGYQLQTRMSPVISHRYLASSICKVLYRLRNTAHHIMKDTLYKLKAL